MNAHPPTGHVTPQLKVLPRMKPRRVSPSIPPLSNGDRLSGAEFLRRYAAMPDVKAELIDGIVFISSPVRHINHGKPDVMIHGLLFFFETATPGVDCSSNSTVQLAPDDIPQPDAWMRLLPEKGGKSTLDKQGYLSGAPELVVEVAASSVAIDAHGKLEAYRRAGVQEYLLCLIETQKVHWLSLDDGIYTALPQDKKGVVRSRVFLGFGWIRKRCSHEIPRRCSRHCKRV